MIGRLTENRMVLKRKKYYTIKQSWVLTVNEHIWMNYFTLETAQTRLIILNSRSYRC